VHAAPMSDTHECATPMSPFIAASKLPRRASIRLRGEITVVDWDEYANVRLSLIKCPLFGYPRRPLRHLHAVPPTCECGVRTRQEQGNGHALLDSHSTAFASANLSPSPVRTCNSNQVPIERPVQIWNKISCRSDPLAQWTRDLGSRGSWFAVIQTHRQTAICPAVCRWTLSRLVIYGCCA
jgi:hypothetical protein